MISILMFLLIGQSHATTVDSYLHNRQGVQKYSAKEYYPAYQFFLKGLESDPLNPELHMNLGITFEANEEMEKAAQAYNGALQLLPQDSPQRFAVYFNLGNVYGKLKKIAEALQAYQAALEINPDSKEVKTNIELLWQGGGGEGEGESQGGKGDKGKDQKPNDPKDNKGEQPKDDQKKADKPKKQQPRPFKSEDLTPQDVKKILDEIKNQEQSIRAQEYERKGKDAPQGKDW